MAIAQSLIPELEREMAVTRTVLSRIPDNKFDYKPHPTSMSFGDLAAHVAEMTSWCAGTLTMDGVDIAGYQPTKIANNAELLAHFDKGVTAAKQALLAASDQDLMKQWTLKNGDNVMFSMPRIGVIRGMIMNHIIHHRGQLSVYLRMNGIKVPSMYGPSADEQS